MKNTLLFLFSLLLMSLGSEAQGNWEASNTTVLPGSVVSSAGTLTLKGSFKWTSTSAFVNDNHLATLNFALPSSLYVSTGTPSLVYVSTNTAVPNTIFTYNNGGWKCDFATGATIAPDAELEFTISGIEIKDDQAYSNELVSSFITFIAIPSGDSYNDNSSSNSFSTTLNTPLPVGLLSFDARLRDRDSDPKVELTWTTIEEKNASHFIVERSQNASYWVEVVSVDAQGNTTDKTDYRTFDNDPIKGVSYYRLKQVDEDNAFTYSEVRVIDLDSKGILQVFPNPTSDLINVQFMTQSDGQVEMKLQAADGRVVQSLLAKVGAGSNKIEMDVKDLAEGVYDVSIYLNNELLDTSKILKK